MRQRLTIILTIIVVLGVLIILNVVTYVGEDKAQESELTANRSTYHAGPTGSRALYDLLSESGYKVMRWRDPPQRLLDSNGQKVQTFVVIGRTQVEFEEEQATSLLLWVERGGHLILIDRRPDTLLLPQTGEWTIATGDYNLPSLSVDPGNPKEMTENVKALQPVQPTLLTQEIQTVLPSRFASRINVSINKTKDDEERHAEHGARGSLKDAKAAPAMAKLASPAPVVHIADGSGALLVDYPHGLGRIVVISDPYLISNGGIGLKDNLQLAINALTSTNGLIAFDEYHQGRGITQNAFASYFSGTPVLAIGAQLILLVLIILWTRARRFARPLPLVQVDRRSSLEFVASMAELQERSRAFDLAIENIYSRTRRVLARHAGVDYNSPRAEIAKRVASRSTLEANQLETLMRRCEETINGASITWRQAIDLVRRLRQVEQALGLRMRSREVRQATRL